MLQTIWNQEVIDYGKHEKKGPHRVEGQLKAAQIEEQRAKYRSNQHAQARERLQYAVHSRKFLLGEDNHEQLRA